MSIVSFLGRNESPNHKDERLSKKPRIEENIDDVIPISSDENNDDSTSRLNKKTTNPKSSNRKNEKFASFILNLIFIMFYL